MLSVSRYVWPISDSVQLGSITDTPWTSSHSRLSVVYTAWMVLIMIFLVLIAQVCCFCNFFRTALLLVFVFLTNR